MVKQVCPICDEEYEVGDGTGKAGHFAFRHQLTATETHKWAEGNTLHFEGFIGIGPDNWGRRYDSNGLAVDEA